MGTLNQQEIEARLQELEQQEKALMGLVQKLTAEDPFWTFVPSGLQPLSEERWNFLKKWLEAEDLPSHLDTQADVFRSEAQIVGMFGGNQVGKTLTNVIKAIVKITGEVPEGLKGIFPQSRLSKRGGSVHGRVYSPSSSTIDEVLIPKFQTWMPRSYWHKDGWERTYSKQDKILRFYKDGRKFVGQIKFISYEQEVSKTQGATLNFVHFDEEPPYEFYKEALPRFVANGGLLDIEFFMTPTNGISWVKELILDKADGKTISVFKVSTITNPYTDLTVLDEMMKGLDTYEERKMRLLGEFVSLSGLIYKGECALVPSIHVIPAFDLDYHNYVVYRGLDVHLSKPTCCVDLAVDRMGNEIVCGVYYEDADTEKVKEALAKRAVERRYRLGWSRVDKSLDYEIEALGGINIVHKLRTPPNAIPALFSSEKYKGSIDAGIDEIKRKLKVDRFTKKPKLLFMDKPEIWPLINDIQTLERDKANNEDKRGIRDKVLEGKKDFHAALRYVEQGDPVWLDPDDDLTPHVPEEEHYI